VPAPAAPGQNEFVVVPRQISDDFAFLERHRAFDGVFGGGEFGDDGSGRNLNEERLSLATGPLAPFAVVSARGEVMGLVAQVGQVIAVRIDFENDIPPFAAIASVRPTLRDKGLTPEAAASVASFSPTRPNPNPIDKH